MRVNSWSKKFSACAQSEISFHLLPHKVELVAPEPHVRSSGGKRVFLIGGIVAGSGNTIRGNLGSGSQVLGASFGNSLRGNSINANNGLGIDLNGTRLHAVVPSGEGVPVEGDQVALSFSREAMHVMEGEA